MTVNFFTLNPQTDRSQWTAEVTAAVNIELSNLLISDAQLRNKSLLGLFESSKGSSLAAMYDTASVGHCCKVVFKYYAIDHLLLYLPADKTRKQLLTRIVKSAKPDFQDGDGDLMSVLKDYWYTWCSLCLFLNDRAKWEGLPRMARLLVILLEIMAHQYISSDVSPFHVATYAAAVFCLESLARSQLGELYSHTSDLAGTSEKYDCVLSSEGSKGTLYSHQNCHAVHDLERTDPLPHGFTDEHKIDQAIAKFTKIGVRLQGKRGLENIMRLFLSNEQMFLSVPNTLKG